MATPSNSPQTRSKTAKEKNSEQPTQVEEECPICCIEYQPDDKRKWKILKCSHKLCVYCHQNIKQRRMTMSGIWHTFFKCPFCQASSGIEVGTCPNGRMQVDVVATGCEGYEAYGSIRITYDVSGSEHHLYRVAYLPDNDEGKELLRLLKIAWDRRISFAIGRSVTTGQDNVLVWNVHHKTSQFGGPSCYGYPDPEYFQRLKLELRQFGIE